MPAPKPIKHTLEHDSDDVMIAASPTAIFVDGITVLELSPKTPKDDIRTAVEVVLKSSKKSRDRRVFINADKSLAYAQIIEILEAANHAGFKDIVFGVAPHD